MITLHSKDLRFSLGEREEYFRSFKGTGPDGVLLATCNRIEWYAGSGQPPVPVIRHLFRVVCGLESALIGENAIQAQVKAAYEQARAARPLSPELHRLFQHALRVGKRVRTETGISRGAMSHSKAVLEILRQDGVEVAKAKILIIGVNNLNASVVQYLVEKGSRTIFVANRTYARALELSRQYECEAVRFEGFAERLKEADILISATSAPHYIVKRGQFIPVKPVVIFDLAVPRDVDPAFAEYPRISLYNIEDIEKRVSDNRSRRMWEVEKAEKIIEEEIRTFHA